MNEILARLGVDHLIVLDIETYFDKDYSLRKLSTTDYIRNPLFRIQSFAYCEIIDGVRGPTKCYNENEHCIADEIHRLFTIYDPAKTAVVAHNSVFDWGAISYHYDIVPKFIFDTLSMARGMLPHNVGAGLDVVAKRLGFGSKIKGALNAVKGLEVIPPELMATLCEYNIHDTELCADIFLDLIKDFPFTELELIDLTLKLYIDPRFVGDKKIAIEEYDREVKAKQKLLETLAEERGTTCEDIEKNLSSNAKFPALLEQLGVEVPLKWSVKQEKWVPALAKNDLAFQELLEHPNEDVQFLCQARLNVKSTIAESRAQRFARYAASGPVPILLKMYGAHTQRWSGGDKFNPQNFPRNSLLKEALRAPDGYTIIVIDSAQIEARCLAYLAGHEDLLIQFADPNLDPYKEQAAKTYGKPVIEITDIERFVGKVAILGLGYGMGAKKYQYTLASGMMGDKVIISEYEAEQVKRSYRETNHKIVEFWWDLEDIFGLMVQGITTEKYGMVFEPDAVLMPNGLYIQYPNLRGVVNPYSGKIGDFTYDSKYGPNKLYGGKIAENITQSFARSVVAEQILRISRRYKPLLAVHDEGVFLVPNEEVDEAKKFIYKEFTIPPQWASGIPLDGDIKIGNHYCK